MQLNKKGPSGNQSRINDYVPVYERMNIQQKPRMEIQGV
jgi:hypothetical protein